MNKEKLWISGAAGFIASCFWHQFQDKYDLTGCDKFGYASQVDERTHNSVWERDCTNLVDMEMELQRSGAQKVLILHSSTHNDTSLKNPLQFYKDNVMGTASVLEACRRQSIKQVYLVSTDETIRHLAPASGNYFMFDGPQGFDQQTHKGRTFYRAREMDIEWTSFNPTSPYSSSKACQEMMVNAFRKAYGMNITVIRPTNVFGPGQFPEKLIPVAITNALQDKPIPLYGKGLEWRDYTYVEDTCRALDFIISLEAPDNLYHISANDERQNIETVREVLRQLGKKSEALIKFIEDPRKGAHDPVYSLSSAKIRNLGWAPQVSFEEGIGKSIDFYRNKR